MLTEPDRESKPALCVGLDPSLSSAGICWILGDRIDTTTVGARFFGTTLRQRIKRAEHAVQRMVEVVGQQTAQDIDIVLVEGYSFGSRHNTFWITELGALLRRRMRILGWPVAEVPPKSLKMFATDNGNAQKALIAKAVKSRYGISFGTTDEADAFALAKIAQCVMGGAEPQTVKQAKVVEQVRARWLAETEAE